MNYNIDSYLQFVPDDRQTSLLECVPPRLVRSSEGEEFSSHQLPLCREIESRIDRGLTLSSLNHHRPIRRNPALHPCPHPGKDSP